MSAAESLVYIDADKITLALNENYPPSFALLARYITNAIGIDLVIIQYDIE